jgi:hypothetical protein
MSEQRFSYILKNIKTRKTLGRLKGCPAENRNYAKKSESVKLCFMKNKTQNRDYQMSSCSQKVTFIKLLHKGGRLNIALLFCCTLYKQILLGLW